MRRSIRWTLLGWYAAILAAVLAVFGALVYRDRHRTAFETLDAELRAHVVALAGSIEWELGEGLDLEEAVRHVAQLEASGPDAPYAVVWDGWSREGAPAASGLYLCELRAGGRRAVRKMLLLK